MKTQLTVKTNRNTIYLSRRGNLGVSFTKLFSNLPRRVSVRLVEWERDGNRASEDDQVKKCYSIEIKFLAPRAGRQRKEKTSQHSSSFRMHQFVISFCYFFLPHFSERKQSLHFFCIQLYKRAMNLCYCRLLPISRSETTLNLMRGGYIRIGETSCDCHSIFNELEESL